MKISDFKTSLSVFFCKKEATSFKAHDTSTAYPNGIELHYLESPCGVIVKSGKEEVWVNINNICYMKFSEEVITPERVSVKRAKAI